MDTVFNKNNLKQIIATIDFEASKFNDYLNYVFFFFHEIQFDDECNSDSCQTRLMPIHRGVSECGGMN